MKTTTTATMGSVRQADLRRMLQDRRRELQNDVQSRSRDVRADGPSPVLDAGEHSDADVQDDIELALIQMRAHTVGRIDEALVRLDASEYGFCVECAEEISERRLRALPFAVRCTACGQCHQDCPYDAIELVPRTVGPAKYERQAEVNPAKCVGCRSGSRSAGSW